MAENGHNTGLLGCRASLVFADRWCDDTGNPAGPVLVGRVAASTGALSPVREMRFAETVSPWIRRRHTGHRWSSDVPDRELHQPSCGRASTASAMN